MRRESSGCGDLTDGVLPSSCRIRSASTWPRCRCRATSSPLAGSSRTAATRWPYHDSRLLSAAGLSTPLFDDCTTSVSSKNSTTSGGQQTPAAQAGLRLAGKQVPGEVPRLRRQCGAETTCGKSAVSSSGPSTGLCYSSRQRQQHRQRGRRTVHVISSSTGYCLSLYNQLYDWRPYPLRDSLQKRLSRDYWIVESNDLATFYVITSFMCYSFMPN